MSTTLKPPLAPTTRTQVFDLIETITKGDILGAMDRFYAPDVVMQENSNPPTTGLAANIEREKKFLAKVKQWNSFTVRAVAIEGDTAFIECTLDFIDTTNKHNILEQVAVQRWKNGRITHERFYYNAAN